MTIDPFSGEVRDGCLLGRGASDTKGTAAAMLWALRRPQSRQAGALEQVLLRPFAFLGRWSLTYYMLHQPVMLGGLALWQYARVIG